MGLLENFWWDDNLRFENNIGDGEGSKYGGIKGSTDVREKIDFLLSY